MYPLIRIYISEFIDFFILYIVNWQTDTTIFILYFVDW